MRVCDVMVTDVKICNPGTNLAVVSEIFWSQGCGTLPVVEDGRVVGMLTDRDVAIALGTRNARAAETLVRDVALPKQVFFCDRDDDIHKALQTMQTHRVRRLPVIDKDGGLRGILCLNDLLERARETRGDLTYEDVIVTMREICSHKAELHAA